MGPLESWEASNDLFDFSPTTVLFFVFRSLGSSSARIVGRVTAKRETCLYGFCSYQADHSCSGHLGEVTGHALTVEQRQIFSNGRQRFITAANRSNWLDAFNSIHSPLTFLPQS